MWHFFLDLNLKTNYQKFCDLEKENLDMARDSEAFPNFRLK